MGCCQTKPSAEENIGIQALGNPVNRSKSMKEDKIELAFRAKRANIFTEGVDLARNAYVKKNIPKTAQQLKLIITAVKQNYVFDALTDTDIEEVAKSMEVREFSAGENIVVQGEKGDFYYVIESGNLTVVVDGKAVSTLTTGSGFGELALVYNSPRQATVRAENKSLLFSLDRETYRFIIAQSSTDRTVEVKQALHRVPLLADLTDDQLDKVTDAVELFKFEPGSVIIKKGSEGKVFYMVKEGVVQVTDMGSDYSDHTLVAGDYFGERALLTGEPRAATIIAQTQVTLMALDREAFINLLGPLRELLDYNMNLRILSSIKLFEKLTKQEMRKLSQSMIFELHPVNSIIIKQGEHGKKFYIIKSGTVKVEVDNKEVTQLSSGGYFGELALLDDDVRKATVIAITECELFVVDRATFTKIFGALQHILDRTAQERLEVLKGAGPKDLRPEPELQLKFSDLINLAVLGSGTFGRVTLVQDKKGKNVYALKALLKSEIVAHKQQTNVMNEKNVMLTSNHPFILRLYQTFKDAKKLFMLLEFVQGGELFSVLHTSTSDGVPDHQAKFYGAAILLALGYLHNKDIAYRDMKPENCLIDKAGYPKLVDFGFAKVINGKSYTLCGTPEYLAPELVLARGHTKAVDYWAFGILLYEMQAGYSPFSDPQGMDQVVICKNIVNGRLVFPRNFNTDCKDLVKRLLSREVQTRLGNLKNGVEDIKQQKWFSDIDFEAVFKKSIRAPWVPKVSSNIDTSNFDPYGVDDHVDEGYVDHGNWDKDF